VINTVGISKSAEKDLKKVPRHILDKFEVWVRLVEMKGLREVMKIKGFHDEPLHGQRKGQRSIRLSKGYRAIYRILSTGAVEFVRVEEVSKHEY
jgi:proteic killer suppression protein